MARFHEMGKRSRESTSKEDLQAARELLEAEQEALVLSAEEQAKRNANIFGLWLGGASIVDLARMYELSPHRVSDIIKTRKAEGKRLENTTFLEVLQDWDLRNEAAISELARVASRNDASPAAVTQAIMARISREDRRLAVYQAVGILPEDLGTLAVPLNGMKLAGEILEILDEKGVLTDEILEAISKRFGGGAIDGDAVEVEQLEA